MFFDVTSYFHIALYTLVVRILEDDDNLPLIISSSIISRNETSEQQRESFLDAMQCEGMMVSSWE